MVNTNSERGPLPCNGWLCSGLIMDPANRTPRIEIRKRKTFVFKTSSHTVMNPKKNAIRPADVVFTNCAPRTCDTESAIRKRTTKADERYDIKFTGRTKRCR